MPPTTGSATRVAISGDTAVVGAPWHDVGGNADQGSAYVFVRNGGTWSLQAQLFASNGGADDWFGISVAISGDTIVVGANQDDVGANVNQGSAYVFARSGSTWNEQVWLYAGDGSEWDGFGRAVAISGDTAVVGAVGDDVGANIDQGSAYVFVRQHFPWGQEWGEQAQLLAADGAGATSSAARSRSRATASWSAPPIRASAPTTCRARPTSSCAVTSPGASRRS